METAVIHVLSTCPVCHGKLRITELACSTCQTVIRNSFEPSRFCALTPEQVRLLEAFLRNRGNLTGTASELGVSTPTVGRRLDGILQQLELRKQGGVEPAIPPARQREVQDRRREILEQLDRGEITAEEATRRIREM